MTDQKETAMVIPGPGRELELQPAHAIHTVDVKLLIQQRADFVEFTKSLLKLGTDYGKIPGAGDKPTLLKPGAEKILRLYNCRTEYDIQDISRGDTIRYSVVCRAVEINSGLCVASGAGSANSGEQKYQQQIKSRNERMKKDKAPVTAEDVDNTLLKMAMKRAMVSCAQALGCASEFFTQDIEDMDIGGPRNGYQDSSRPARQRQAQRRADTEATPASATGSKPADEAKMALRVRHDNILAKYVDSVGEGGCRNILASVKEWNGDKSDDVTLDAWLSILEAAAQGMTDDAIADILRISRPGSVEDVAANVSDWLTAPGDDVMQEAVAQ